MVRAKFRCPQNAFPAVVIQIVNAFIANIAAFSGSYPNLTLVYANGILTALTAAQNLPDITARNAANEELRDELEALNEALRAQFQFLQDYIEAAFPSIFKTKWTAAGWTYFKKGPLNWNATVQMAISMTLFITVNSVILLANGMPATFAADLALLVADFNAKLAAYNTAKNEIQVAADDKMNAYNAIYSSIKPIMKGALRVNLSATVKKQFQFSHVVGIIIGHGPSGFEGVVISFATGLPIRNVSIKIGALTIITDHRGKYSVSLDAGRHYGLVSAPDPAVGTPYADQLVLFVVKTGTITTLNIQMLQ